MNGQSDNETLVLLFLVLMYIQKPDLTHKRKSELTHIQLQYKY